MDTNFDACLTVTLAYEGGYSRVRGDPGNWTGGKVGIGALKGTKYGIAASAHPTLDIANVTRGGAGIIYRADYWAKIGGDTLPLGVDLAVFDSAVNSGPAKALKWLGAARANASTPDGVITAICATRLSFLHALGNWRAFGRGWGVRVAAVEAEAHRMALGSDAVASGIIRAKAAVHAGRATRGKATASASGLVGMVGAAGSVASGGMPHALVILGLLIALAAAGVLAFMAWRDAQRATALAAEAKTSSFPAHKASGLSPTKL